MQGGQYVYSGSQKRSEIHTHTHTRSPGYQKWILPIIQGGGGANRVSKNCKVVFYIQRLKLYLPVIHRIRFPKSFCIHE